MYKAAEPCEAYFGNVCTGFGGTTDCVMCGWDMYDHDPHRSEAERWLRENEVGNDK